MDGEYFNIFKQEAAASATRAVAAIVYGAIAVYVFATVVSGSLPRVAAVLSVGPNASDE